MFCAHLSTKHCWSAVETQAMGLDWRWRKRVRAGPDSQGAFWRLNRSWPNTEHKEKGILWVKGSSNHIFTEGQALGVASVLVQLSVTIKETHGTDDLNPWLSVFYMENILGYLHSALFHKGFWGYCRAVDTVRTGSPKSPEPSPWHASHESHPNRPHDMPHVRAIQQREAPV